MRYVYLFHEGNARMKELLGGKGANLAEMTNIGLPVPCGMTITTDACREYYNNGKKLPEGLVEEVTRNLKAIEAEAGKRFGDEDDPLLLSVRSGAVFSMPGMMDTILNLGLNAATFKALAMRKHVVRLRHLPAVYPDVLGCGHGNPQGQVRAYPAGAEGRARRHAGSGAQRRVAACRHR